MKTPLDRALAALAKDPDKELEFYELFLNSDLYIPTTNTPEKEETRLSREGDTISPVFVEVDGELYLMIFDTEKKLATWAKREIGFVQIPGVAIVEMMDPNIRWMLNVGSKYQHEFDQDEIKWLKESVEQ